MKKEIYAKILFLPDSPKQKEIRGRSLLEDLILDDIAPSKLEYKPLKIFCVWRVKILKL